MHIDDLSALLNLFTTRGLDVSFLNLYNLAAEMRGLKEPLTEPGCLLLQ